MEMHPRFQELMRVIEMWRKFAKMYDFGAPTEKGSWFYMNDEAITDITSYIPANISRKSADVEMVKHYTDSSGSKRITGGKDMKKSQAYPRGLHT